MEAFSADFKRRFEKACQIVADTNELFVIGIIRDKDGIWTATVAMNDVIDEKIIHADDPSLFKGKHADGPTAILMAKDKAMAAIIAAHSER